MQTVLTTNNAYDSILLIDEDERVVSALAADKKTIAAYLEHGHCPGDWQTGEFFNFADPTGEENEDELRTIAAYGTECGRNGQITDPRRREFWAKEVK